LFISLVAQVHPWLEPTATLVLGRVVKMPANEENLATLPQIVVSTVEPVHAERLSASDAPVMLPGFVGVAQVQSQWCWAAAGASIYNYYRALAGGVWPEVRQCDCVESQLHKLGCFASPRPACCLDHHELNKDADKPGQLYIELKRLDLLACEPVLTDGTTSQQQCNGRPSPPNLSHAEIIAEISAGHPMAVRVKLTNSNADEPYHFLIFTGFRPAPSGDLFVWDPDQGHVHFAPGGGGPFSILEFIKHFGTPTHKYFTRTKSEGPAS
jgi:hypothetical protein